MESWEKAPMQYCPHCGLTRIIVLGNRKSKCGYCNYTLKDTNESCYEINILGEREGIDDDEYVRIHYVYNNPEYDKNAEEYRKIKYKEELEELKHRNNAEFTEKFFAERNAANLPKCPSCGSTNISKIGIGERAVSVGLFGILSNKIGKSHKCNNCGNMW